MNLWEDARVVRGMRAQLELRRKRLDAGDAPLGWKVGFAAPAMLQRLDITGPLVGFLTRAARVQSGGSVSLAGWLKPVAEPEIAVHIGRDVSAGADHATAKAAIAGISPAIEIVDLTAPPEDPERILSANIYQRHVVLDGGGPARAGSASGGLTCRVIRRASEFARTSDPQANTGEWVGIVRHVPTCSRPSASGCAAEKSSSRARWCRRSRSSRARRRSRSRSIRSRASRSAFPVSSRPEGVCPLVRNIVAAASFPRLRVSVALLQWSDKRPSALFHLARTIEGYVEALCPSRHPRCNSRRVGAAGTGTDPSLAAAAGPLHPSVRSGRRRRHRRAPYSGSPASTLGQAGGDREPSGRRQHDRDPGCAIRQRRSHLPMGAER